LRAAVGDAGHVYGIDLSAGMLTRARSLVDQHRWRNVTLVHGDAVDYQAPEPLDGVLFGFSYSTMRIITRSSYRHWRSCGQAAASA
jgi:ubiquinone/menaquinone biosynthesis C-methylase UbiE